MKHNQGFTLIELMITIVIMSVLATIAYASYTQYIVRNAEAQAEARMQSLAMELDRYRSSRLTYRGFVPKKVGSNDSGETTETYAYDNGNSVDTNASKNKYIISITNGANNPLVSNDLDFDGSQWVMFAVPNSDAMSSIKYKYVMTSTGQRCRSYNDDFAFDGKNMATICQNDTGVESW